MSELLRGEARLVTLTGTAGIGKTCLALAVAGSLVEQFPDGIWLGDLAGIREPDLVPSAVAAAVGPGGRGPGAEARLLRHLRRRRALLVLDTCEHVVGGVAALASRILEECAEVRILATSREILHVDAEVAYRVPPLAVPPGAPPPTPDEVAGYAAVQLFVERARALKPDFALGPEVAAGIASICRSLEGVPLAIELAAARVRVLRVGQIVDRLATRFDVLTDGDRTAPPRHRSLRAAIDWSHSLLPPREAAVFRRLGVFAGGFPLDGAEAICPDPGSRAPGTETVGRASPPSDLGPPVTVADVLDLLTRLIDQSMVEVDRRVVPPRYRLLEPLRRYALDRLAEAGAVALMRDRHLAWCDALAQQALAELAGPRRAQWLADLATEQENLRAALAWSAGRGRTGRASAPLARALDEVASWQRAGVPSLPRGGSPGSSEPLSERERAILRLVSAGRSNKQIARELGLGERTVKTYLTTARRKLGADNRAHAAVIATQHHAL